MAEHYIPNPLCLPQVNHINGIKDDFRTENLEWVTAVMNIQLACDTGLIPKNYGKGRHVELLDDNYNVTKTFTSINDTLIHIKSSRTTFGTHLDANEFGDNTALINGFRIRYKVHPNLDGEIWVKLNTPSAKANEKYRVSNYGRVKNHKTSHILSQQKGDGYCKIDLQKSAGDKNVDDLVHRLVAFAFLQYEGDQKEYDVNHIDKITDNNYLTNLEILTHKEHCIKDFGKKVLGLSKDHKYIIFGSRREAAKAVGADDSKICAAVNQMGISGNHYWYDLNSVQAKEIIKTCERNIQMQGQMSDICLKDYIESLNDKDLVCLNINTRAQQPDFLLKLRDNPNDKNRKNKEKGVLGLSKDFTYVIFKSQIEAAKAIGASRDSVGKAIRKIGTSYNYYWYNLNTSRAHEIIEKCERDYEIPGQLLEFNVTISETYEAKFLSTKPRVPLPILPLASQKLIPKIEPPRPVTKLRIRIIPKTEIDLKTL